MLQEVLETREGATNNDLFQTIIERQETEGELFVLNIRHQEAARVATIAEEEWKLAEDKRNTSNQNCATLERKKTEREDKIKRYKYKNHERSPSK